MFSLWPKSRLFASSVSDLFFSCSLIHGTMKSQLVINFQSSVSINGEIYGVMLIRRSLRIIMLQRLRARATFKHKGGGRRVWKNFQMTCCQGKLRRTRKVQLSRSSADACAHLGAPCVSVEACKSAQHKPWACQQSPIFQNRNDAQSKRACYIRKMHCCGIMRGAGEYSVSQLGANCWAM